MRENYNNIKQLCFFPYIGMGIVAVFFFLGATFMFVLSFIVPRTSDKALIAGLGFIAVLFLCIFSVRLPVFIEFAPDGILLRNVLTKEQYSAQWNQFVAAYCMYGSRGHTYLLLSCTEMNISEQKECWKKLQQLRKGRPVLSSDGNICILVDHHFRSVQLLIQSKLPYFPPEKGPQVG